MSIDLAGIGIGPFNLSIAALLPKAPDITYHFFDSKPEFAWHPGLLLPEADMQTCYLKDLVIGVDPTSPYSFLAYLVKKKRFYRFVSAELSMISRAEFSDYMSWVSAQLKGVSFASAIESIEYKDKLFHITVIDKKLNDNEKVIEKAKTKKVVTAKNLCLGTGKKPYIPANFTHMLCDNVFHASEIMQRNIDFTNKRVLVIGGGQTGADVALNTLNNYWGKPARFNWISRRSNFQPLDEAAFTNEYFTPEYTRGFFDLPKLSKKREIKSQKLTSDGITTKCLLAIYRILYQRFEVEGENKWLSLLPHRTAQQLSFSDNTYQVLCENALHQKTEIYQADIVILATGFESALPSYLKPLLPMFNLDESGDLQLEKDFQVQWQHADSNSIYAVNSGLQSHGIAEPQLSLASWRSATIINHLAKRVVYDTDDSQGFIEWGEMKPSSIEQKWKAIA